MQANHPQICLYQPEIPQNTGTIARLAAATNCRLHLIRPLGFTLSDKNLRRPGLDYWPYLDLEIHDQIEPLLARSADSVALLSKFGKKDYWEIPSETKLIVFGRETSGLPENLHEEYCDNLYRIPMWHEGVRSLNLANAVSIVIYEQLRKIAPHRQNS